MAPLVQRLEKELEIKIEKLEVWHDEKNQDKMRVHANEIADACGGELGLPTFFYPKTKRALCGEVSYDELKAWVEGK